MNLFTQIDPSQYEERANRHEAHASAFNGEKSIAYAIISAGYRIAQAILLARPERGADHSDIE